MNSLISISAALAGLLALSAVGAQDRPGITAPPDSQAAPRSVVQSVQIKGVAHPGTPIFKWFQERTLGVRDGFPFSYEFSSSGNHATRLERAVSSQGSKTSRQETYVHVGIPSPPIDPARVGSTNTSNLCGHRVSVGTESGFANVLIVWRMQYTRDSNGDGVKDSDPEWVIESIAIADIELGVSEPPIGDC